MKKLKYIILILIIGLFSFNYAQAGFFDWFKSLWNQNLGATILHIYQGGTSTSTTPTDGQLLIGSGGSYKVNNLTAGSNITLTNGSGTISIASTGGGSGGSTTTIAGLKPDTDIFFLTSTSGIAISTSSPDTIRFNLNVATTTELAITGLAGQTGCLSVNAQGKVATSTCSGGTGITSLNGQTGSTQTFSTSTDTNVQLRIVSATNDHQFTPVWAGTLADSRITSAGTWNAKITTTSLSETITGIDYDNVGGIFSITSGYNIPLTASTTNFQTAYGWGNHATAGYQSAITLASSTSGSDFTITNANPTWTFNLPSASGVNRGLLTSADWTTFNGKQNNITWPIAVASTSLTGGVGLTLTTNDMACDTASGSVFGCLASADWTTFNNKQGSLTFPLVYASTTHLTATSPLLITAGDLSLTGRLSTINGIATTTGNLIVGRTDTTGWYGLVVGSNGKVLTASSTATDGISWETVVASASAGGANTNIQVNEAGAIAGYAGFNYSSSTQMLTVGTSTISGLVSCNTIDTDGAGKLVCGTDETGGGTESGWRVSSPFVYLATSTDIVGIGATSTLAKLFIQNATTASTTLFLQKSANQTGNLLSIASSTGTILSGINSDGLFMAATGTVALPSITFLSDTNTGLYRNGADNLGITTGGTLRWDIDTTDIVSTLPYRTQSGTAASPAYGFSSDINTGIYSGGNENLSFSINGTGVAELNQAGIDYYFRSTTAGAPALNLIDIGSPIEPSYTFKNDLNTGMYRIIEDNLGFSTGGSLRMSVASSSQGGIVSLTTGTTTISIGGSSLAAGACSATSLTVPYALSTSTDNIWATPQVYPGDSAYWKAWITTSTITQSTVNVAVCESITATPTASAYNITIIRNLNNQ